jgi:hypothetical protein
MFFEPPTAEPEHVDRRGPDVPPWDAPPVLEVGSVVAVERIVARSANVVVVVPTIRVFETGCLFNVEVVGRQDTLSPDEWWDLGMSAHPIHEVRPGADRLPDRLLRFGVRYANGARATTLGLARPPATDPPTGPVLSWQPSGSGGGRHGGEFYMFHHMGLWLWPLPPAERFEFAVEWPFGGIDLTLVEFDGAAIVSAAGRSVRYWPETVDDDRR